MLFGNTWFEDISQVALKPGARTLFVDLAQTAVTDDIGDQDGCKTVPGPFRECDVLRSTSYSRSPIDTTAASEAAAPGKSMSVLPVQNSVCASKRCIESAVGGKVVKGQNFGRWPSRHQTGILPPSQRQSNSWCAVRS